MAALSVRQQSYSKIYIHSLETIIPLVLSA